MNKLIRNLLFPPKCKSCGKLADNNLCDSCKTKLSALKFNPDETKDKKDIPFVDKNYSSYFYRDTARDIVIRAKFNNPASFLNSFTDDVQRDIDKIISENAVDIIVAVPSHKSKMYKQEYDLPTEMAKRIRDYTKISHLCCITKVRKTKSQHNLAKDERKSNLVNAFEVTEDVTDKTILIVDDVVTSGNTLSAIATELRLAGCKSVLAYTYTYNEEVISNGRRK